MAARASATASTWAAALASAAERTGLALGGRVYRALGIAAATLGRLVDRPPGVDLNELEAAPDKIVAETAMLVRVVARLPQAAGIDSAQLAEVAHAVARHAQSRRIAIGMALHPALARDYGAAHIVLSAAGFMDEACDRALARAAAASVAEARERPPHRELEQAWLGWLAGGPRPAPALAARTSLGRGSDVLLGTRDDLYALTHALIYATDFGAERPRLPRAAAVVTAECDSALAGVLDDDDFDLAAELLLAAPYLRRRWSPAAAFGLSVLTSVEDRVGFLPSLSLDREGVARQAPADRDAYVAAMAYHTAYVMGLLCAAILKAPHPPSPPRQGTAPSPLAGRLLDELEASSRNLQWIGVARALTPRARAPLTGFLLDVAVRRAARALDLTRVRDLLVAGHEARVPATPLRLQAAELLGRLADVAAPTHSPVASRNGRSPCPGPINSEPANRSAEVPSA